MSCKLFSVIEGDCAPQIRGQRLQPSAGSLGYRLGLPLLQTHQVGVATLAFHQAKQASLLSRADDGVTFPIPITLPSGYGRRPVLDRRRIGDLPTSRGLFPHPTAEISLPTLGVIIRIEPGVDRRPRKLAARIAGKITLRTSSNLVRRPVLLEPRRHVLLGFRRLQFCDPRPLSSPLFRLSLRNDSTILVAAAVARQLPADGRPMPIQRLGNLRWGMIGEPHLRYDFTFLGDKMLGHCWDSVRTPFRC